MMPTGTVPSMSIQTENAPSRNGAFSFLNRSKRGTQSMNINDYLNFPPAKTKQRSKFIIKATTIWLDLIPAKRNSTIGHYIFIDAIPHSNEKVKKLNLSKQTMVNS